MVLLIMLRIGVIQLAKNIMFTMKLDGLTCLTVSDCVDLQLYSKNKKKYFDKCCFVRFQKDGDMHSGCVGLFRDSVIDITETIKRMENGDKNIWTSEGINSKIYDLDCKASYIHIFAIAFALFGLLF